MSLSDRRTISEPGSPADYVIPACKDLRQGSQMMLMIRINYVRRNQTSFTRKCVRTVHEIQEGVRFVLAINISRWGKKIQKVLIESSY